MKNETDKIILTKKEAIDYLQISDKDFKNYHESSKEISGEKTKGRWYFNKDEIWAWKKLKDERTINLTIKEYETCFEFAIKMVYGGLSLNGIRGQRTEMQAADDVILGILAEHATKNFLAEKFKKEIELDEEVHTELITPQDICKIKDGGIFRDLKTKIGIKASKMKNAFLVLGANEVEHEDRVSDVYVFARVGLPSDHLFRILREHSFFDKVRKFIENDKSGKFRKIEEIKNIPVWICGFCYVNELEKVTKIPGQEFTNGHRYVKSVGQLHNTDKDWSDLISKF